MTNTKKRVHFQGIGGAGISAVAQIAFYQGYKVTGCDLQENTPYLSKVKKLGIPVYLGHNPDHLKGVDFQCVSPAVFYQSNSHPETVQARERGILMKWQEFMGKYLHKDKSLICIAGVHGKSTTTSMVGLLLEEAGLDPTVEVGATVVKWGDNLRLGNGKYFVSEADEFHGNFLSYHPDIIILTGIEMDHPEYFITEEKLLATYKEFVENLQGDKVLIINRDSEDNQKLLTMLASDIRVIHYSGNEFDRYGIKLEVPGRHNRENAVAVVKLAEYLEIDKNTIKKSLEGFQGIGRRMETLGEKQGITVIDDYANHPSSYKATIEATREKYPNRRLWTIIEPHTFSRSRYLMGDFPDAFSKADKVIVSKIYAGREKDPGDFDGTDITKGIKHRESRYIPEFSDIVQTLKNEAKKGDVVLVMGSGDSYKLSREILNSL